MGIHRKIRTRRAKIKKVNFLASPREGVRRGNFSRVTVLHIISTLRTVKALRVILRNLNFSDLTANLQRAVNRQPGSRAKACRDGEALIMHENLIRARFLGQFDSFVHERSRKC